MTGPAPLGVYVHIPFCTRRCDYCAFATWTDRFHLVDEYVAACTADLARSSDWFDGGSRPATSLFFGGGTPSLLTPGQLGSIVAAVPLAPGAEVTVECNPDTVDAGKLSGYAAAGVNRLSFGVQSMVPHVLSSLGREHDPDSVRRAVEGAATAGLGASYSVDVIFGARHESVADWEKTVDAVLALDPAPRHVSAYALTVEAGTPLARDDGRHPDPDDQADKYVVADDRFVAAGLRWYEISNWARPGHECRHNQLYWSQGEYLGVGCAAHAHRVAATTGAARRGWNVRTPERYIAAVTGGAPTEAAGEDLDPAARRCEALELSLRTRRGVPVSALPGWSDDPDLDGLVERSDPDRLVLTRRGRLLANEVAIRLRS